MVREYSKVSPRMWGSERFQSLPDHAHQLSFAYLLTGPQVNSAGCYRLNIRHMALDVALTREAARQVLDTLYERLLIGYDAKSDTVLICNWFRFNPPTSGKHAFGTLRQLSDVNSPLRTVAIQELIAECNRRGFTLSTAFTDMAAALQAATPIPHGYPIDRVSPENPTDRVSIPNGNPIDRVSTGNTLDRVWIPNRNPMDRVSEPVGNPGETMSDGGGTEAAPAGCPADTLSIPYRYTETETEGEVEARAEQIDGAERGSTSGTEVPAGALPARARDGPPADQADQTTDQLGEIAQALRRLDSEGQDPGGGGGAATPSPRVRSLEDAMQKREAKARVDRERRKTAEFPDG